MDFKGRIDMSVSDYFNTFCDNLRMNNNTVDAVQNRYHQIVKRINLDYYSINSDSNHGLYVGSYGRGTEIWTSDIDMIIQLPYTTYSKFNSYKSNGQSALLQEVKNVLQKTYSTSHIKADGQVIGIDFKDGISFEIVPGFINEDDSFTYPDTNNGGAWKITDPRAEIKSINSLNVTTNKNLKRLCRMTRAWKENCKVSLNGIIIDTLAYNFIEDYKYKDKSYLYYDYMMRDFFNYLANLNPSQSYWHAPGSNRYVWRIGDFQNKANHAYKKSIEAIDNESNDYHYLAKSSWREIFGNKFPE